MSSITASLLCTGKKGFPEKKSDIGIEPARIVADAREGSGNADLVAGTVRHEAFVEQTTIGIEVDQVAVLGNAAGAEESRKALVGGAQNAIEHLVDYTVNTAIARMLHRNAGR